jgi:uncharacterized protein (DUF1330 family)
LPKQKGNKEMAVFMVMEARIKDQTTYTRYIEGLSGILPDYGGRYLVRGGRTTPLNEGLKAERRQPGLFIILEFPSEVSLRRCLTSREYRKIMPLCHEGAETRAFLLEGEIP